MSAFGVKSTCLFALQMSPSDPKRICRPLPLAAPMSMLPHRFGSGGNWMPEDRVDRRLAAIFAGDIAGYSRLMGADDEGTLRQLKIHRKELVDPKITEHRGRIVKTTGDGILVEFVSDVDARDLIRAGHYGQRPYVPR